MTNLGMDSRSASPRVSWRTIVKNCLLAYAALAFVVSPTLGVVLAKPYFDLLRAKIEASAAGVRMECAGTAMERAP